MTTSQRAPLPARVFAAVGLAVAVAASVAAVVWRAADPVPNEQNSFGFGDLSLVGFCVLGITFAAVGGLLVVRRPSNAVGWVMVVIGACHALAALAVAVTLSAVADGPAAAGAAAVAAWWAMVFATIGGLLFALGFIFPTGRGQTPAWDRFVRVFAILLAAFAVFGLFLRPGADERGVGDGGFLHTVHFRAIPRSCVSPREKGACGARAKDLGGVPDPCNAALSHAGRNSFISPAAGRAGGPSLVPR